jgi:hypothetical protein
VAVVSLGGNVQKHTGTDMSGYYRILRTATKV